MASARTRAVASYAISALALIVAVFATAQVSVALYVQVSYRNFAARTRELEVVAASGAISEYVKNFIDHAKVITGFSFGEYFLGKRSDQSMHNLLEEVRKRLSGCEGIVYLDAPTRVRLGTTAKGAEGALSSLVAGSAAAWIATAGATDSFVAAGESLLDFNCYFPILRDGRRTGLLGLAIDITPAIRRYLVPLQTRAGHDAFLLGKGGTVLWSSLPGAAGSAFEAVEDTAFAERPFSIGGYSLRVLVSDTRAAVLALIDRQEVLRTVVVALIASLFVATVALMARLYRSESRRRVLDDARRELTERVRSRDFELVESEIRYRALFEGASDAILLLSEAGVIFRCNDRVLSVLGHEPQAMIGKTPADFSPVRQPDGTSSVDTCAAVIRRALELSPETVSFVWRGLRKGGEERDFQVSLSTVMAGGINCLQGILRDVTEQRQQMSDLREALEHREILLHELHHRVKNNLQFIVSLLDLQRGFEPEAVQKALRRAQGRIAALAEAYLAAAEVPETLIVETPAFIGTIVRLARGEAAIAGVWLDTTIACEDLRLSLDTAVSIGLVLRELVDNAARYAYAPGSGGVVEISLARDGPSRARLTVRDRGRGMAEGWKDGLGLTIARALAEQIMGTLEIAPADPGVEASLGFPIG